MEVREIVAQETNTVATNWDYLDGPATGVGSDYGLRNDTQRQEAYVCIDQGEVVTLEITICAD